MNWQTKLLHYSLRPSKCLEIQTSLHFTSNRAFLELRIQFIPCHYRIENYHACCFSPGQIQTLKRKKLCTYTLIERLNSSNLVPCASDHIKHFIWLFVKSSSSHWEVSAAVKGVFECKYDNENFNKNITYFICKMTWLHVCSLSITLTSNYWCG